MNGLNSVGRSTLNQMKALIAASTLFVAIGYAPLAQAKPRMGATAPQPEFTRGGGGCTQFGRIDPGRTTPAGNQAANRVLQELIMRRCVMEGVPVTTSEEDRIYPLIKTLTVGVQSNLGNDAALKAQYDTFLANARKVLDSKRMARIEAHVAAALASNTAPRTSDRSQMITESQPAGGTQLLQPEFQRGRGCSVFGTADAGRVSRNVQQAVSRVVLQSVFRRCLLEDVSLTAAEDERLFPALNALAQGAGPRQYEQFVTVARRTLDPVRAARVKANADQAQRGL
ncbi:hypothetical protein ACQ4M3_39420 [Leptolyngbya sp. AN03gr2]|uniref:hypothetical protein n=1 Tax=unclassified Leptolyngbya TaxID=2650499 RepID=UPI003D30F7BD